MYQSISDNPRGSMNDSDVEDQNNSEKPTPSNDDASSVLIKASDDQPHIPDAVEKIATGIGYALAIPIIISLFPILLLYIILSLFFFGTFRSPDEWFKSKDQKGKSIFQKIIGFQNADMKLRILSFATEVRLGCVALLWLVLSLYVPSLKRMTLFDTLLWKCSLFVVAVFLLNLCTFLLTTAIILPIYAFLNYRRRKQSPFMLAGLVWSFSKLLYYGLLLTLWLVYFHKDHGLNPNPSIDKYGTWTLLSLLLRAALGVLKKAVLFHWEANAIIERFKDRVLNAGFHLFYISLILGSVEQSPLKIFGAQKSFKQLIGIDGDEHESMRKDLTLSHVKEVANRLRSLAESMRREDNTTAKIVKQCEEKIPIEDRCWKEIKDGSFDSFASLFTNMCIGGAEHLLKEVQAMHSEEITGEMIRKWTADAYKNCLSVGYTLDDAYAVVKILNLVLSSFIVLVVILFWLITTELAKTNVLITIGTAFISMSVMFSDTCKAFLNGVIFSFVTHPFDIGDRCIIDGNEVEVKKISILTTTCIRIGSEEKMLFPNTDLSNKLIINLESKPDPMDLIEIVLDPSTKSNQIESVRESIQAFFITDGDSNHSYESYHQVIVKEIGNNIIMSIRFKHILNAEDLTHSRCFDKKNLQRYELFIKIKKLLEDQRIESQTLP